MNIEIANRLIKLRKEKGLSQEALAEELGISRQAVSKWERAESSPDTDNLICLAKLYGISLDELLKTDDNIDTIKKEQIKNNTPNDNEEIKKKSFVSIGKDGIHVVDDEDEVHISLQGIQIKDGEDEVNIGKATTINNEYDRHKSKFYKIFSSSLAILIVISYIIMGSIWNLWHPGWIIFLLIPVLTSLLESIEKKDFSHFAYPVFIVTLYLFLGCVFSLWHPGWILFLTIPIYYIICDTITIRT